jgi:hypothetical protein
LLKLESSFLTSVPMLSALVFIVVALKVFRVSGMETTTTVSIVSKADTFALLKGVILTLLPGFLEALTAAALWWWGTTLPREAGGVQAHARELLFSRAALAAWILTLTMFFTIAWPVFLVFFLPVLATTLALRRAFAHPNAGRLVVKLRKWLLVVGIAVGTISLGLLTLASNPWLPLQAITVAGTDSLRVGDSPLPHAFPAYVLNRDDKGATLLLDDPRAVVEVDRSEVEPSMPLCVPHETGRSWKIRASQVVGIDPNVHSPYPECP